MFKPDCQFLAQALHPTKPWFSIKQAQDQTDSFLEGHFHRFHRWSNPPSSSLRRSVIYRVEQKSKFCTLLKIYRPVLKNFERVAKRLFNVLALKLLPCVHILLLWSKRYLQILRLGLTCNFNDVPFYDFIKNVYGWIFSLGFLSSKTQKLSLTRKITL